MTKRIQGLVCGLALVGAALSAQPQTMKPAKAAGAAPKVPYYIDPTVMNLAALVPDPPAVGSEVQKAELAELHRIEAARTPEQAKRAKEDEDNESIFAYKTVFGPGFNPEALPLIAALGDHVKNEQSVAGGALKLVFKRPRPYQSDATLHPVCDLTEAPNSYPSGHGLTGYLEGLTLAELVPEKRVEILARADDYAHNRLVCGVHYPSDEEASRKIAYVVFGYMLATPRFQKDLAAARLEMNTKLGVK
jgi:acid phosphatase (class A)